MTDTIKHFLDKTGTELLYRRVLKNCRNVAHTASEFTENNPILSKGVVGFESDTKKFKVGDGSTLWKALPYFNYSRTELDNLFEAKADKNNTYTIEQVNEALDNIKDLFKEPVVFGGIINEEITPIQESTDRNDYMQVFFCKPLNSFYYRVEEFGTTKYYANWNTKENYMDKWGYPYVGKLYFNVSNEKYYYYSFTGLKKLVMDIITYFENLLDDSDTDIEISYQSASDESIGVVIWSKKFNRFVFSTDEEGDAVYYDNWSTRDHYMSGQSVKPMHFYLNGTDGKLYFTDPEGILIKVTDDFLKAENNQVSKFIPLTDINNAFDISAIFNGTSLLAKDFHWKYYVTADRNVIGILEVTVGQNNSGIEITERFTTSWALSNNTFRPAGEGHNIYTRHCYSYRDDSREIMPGVWTAWYKYSERFTTTEKTKLTELPTNNELKSTLDKKVEEVTLEKTSDLIYTLKVDGQAAGVINIPKDQFLKSADYDSTSHKITLVFETTDGEKTTEIDLTDLIDVYTAGNGLQKSNNDFSIKIDPATESYLTVTPAGLKVSGIKDALASKANKTDVDIIKTRVDNNSNILPFAEIIKAEEVQEGTSPIIVTPDQIYFDENSNRFVANNGEGVYYSNFVVPEKGYTYVDYNSEYWKNIFYSWIAYKYYIYDFGWSTLREINNSFYDIDFSSDPYNFTNSNWKNADTLLAFIYELREYLKTGSDMVGYITQAIDQNRIPRLVNHNTDDNTNYALPVDLNYPINSTSITFVYECDFDYPTKHTRICKLCIPVNDSEGKVTYEILPSDYAVNEQREIALCHMINMSETLDVTPYWGKYLVAATSDDGTMDTIQIAFSNELPDGEMWIRLKGSPTVTVDGTVVTEGIDFVSNREKILHVTKSDGTFGFETLDGVNDEISYNSSGYRVDLYGGSREYITVTDRALKLRLVARTIDLEFPNKTMTAMAYLNIITDTPNITIGNPLITTKYQEDFKLEKGYYELNCLFNGKEWVVAAMKIGEE